MNKVIEKIETKEEKRTRYEKWAKGLDTSLTKEEAREQFEYWTKELDLRHVFTFDEAWEFAVKKRQDIAKKQFRKSIMKVQENITNSPIGLTGDALEKVNPLKHTFADGCYIREIFNPKGELIVTKIHKITHPYFLMKGDMSILTEEGVKRIKAPHHGITPAGTKRIIYTHEDCVFVTVHVTKETDLKKIEEEVIAKDFNEIDEISNEDILKLKEAIC